MSSENTETRTRILQATLDLLEANQGRGVRMSDIAKQAKISRQAVYLHFANRADLLIATTYYLDELKGVQERLTASRTAQTGDVRLRTFIDAWGNYIPEMYGVGKALLAMRDTDEAAAQAWNKRMRDVREGCEAAINALHRDHTLVSGYTPHQATDILWMMLSVRNWEQLTIECGWSQEAYIEHLTTLARRIFVVGATPHEGMPV